MKLFKRLLVSALIVLFVFSPAFATVGDTVAKTKLSGSTSGMGIKVVATATAGTLIHTAAAGSTNYDEVWIWVVNTHTGAVDLTIEYGGVTDPDSLINKDSIPVEDGLYLVVPGLILQGGLIIRAFASQANVLVIYGYVNQMTE
ncbi:hypothetical protein LCGC14_2067720 [marine sediment metagenome]|uniref:Uncharacterized protein n=1 Tax=marine sediment metagenome TaxID=412755 RepID=A0A0F9F6N8_9ZZZZ|nr:hypothetical protein [Desulfobacterales bacterium]